MQPRSRGSLRLQQSNPDGSPEIDLGHLSDPADVVAMRTAVRHAAELVGSSAMAQVVSERLGPDSSTCADDAALDSWIRAHLSTSMHLSASAPMGPADDPAAVVDGRGRVHGVAHLRAIDTAILASVPTRGPAATAVMLGDLLGSLPD